MKILHILDHSIPLHSGYAFRTRAIIQNQRARGWQTAQITSAKHESELKDGYQAVEKRNDYSGQTVETVEGFSFYRTAKPAGVLSRLPVVKQFAVISSLARRLEDVIVVEKPDILHAHSPALNGVAALRVGRKLRLPVVYEVRAFWEDAAVDHGSCREGDLRYRLTQAMETYVLHRAGAITTICEGLRAEILSRGISNDRVVVIPNAVDIDKFSLGGEADEELVRQYQLDGKLTIGFIGSFYAYEGLALLLEAMPVLLRNEPSLRLLLIGGGAEETELRTLADSLGLGDKVKFLGRVPHNEIQRYYDLIDIFIYPRLRMRLTETVTPLKPLEAMARGRLVVASDVGGHREIIRHGENGVIFNAGDVNSLVSVVLDLVRDRVSWMARRRTARKYVEDERVWPVSVERYAPVYESLVSHGRGVVRDITTPSCI